MIILTELQGTIKGMDCASCVAKITKNIKNMSGVSEVKVNLVTTKISVNYDDAILNEQEIKRMIKRMGYTYQETLSSRSFFNLKENKNLSFALIGAIFLITGIIFDALAIPHLHPLFLAIAIGIGGIPIYIKAFAAVKALTIDIDLLMVLAIIGASIIGEWEEAAEIVVLFSFAELLEAFAMDRTRNSIRELMDLTPDTANKLDFNDVQSIVPVDELVVGDRISVKPGGKIPIDGKVEWGRSYVDQSAITGESRPIDKTTGAFVYAGSINGQGSLKIRVTSMPSESTISRIIQMVEDAENKKAKTEQFIQTFAKYYTPIMVLVAILVTFIPVVILGQPFNEWFYRSLVVLIVSCPCALVLSTPITVVTAITRASKNGVLIKGGKYLEELSKVKAVAIDKTGTLTSGKVRVYKVEPLNKFTEYQVMELASGLEFHSEHLIAQAIISYAENIGITSSSNFSDVETIPGKGIKGIKNGSTYYIGNSALVDEIHGTTACLACGETECIVSYVMKDTTVIGHIHMSDELRPETKEVVSKLKKIGVENITMLTGDNDEIASVIAKELGIDYQAELLPNEKVEAVQSFKKEHKTVAMIGDGINDAPALAVADVGISMGTAGTSVAIETSDIVLSSDNLASLPYLFKLSKQAERTIQINVTLSLAIKLIFFTLVFFYEVKLWMAVLLGDMGASLLVIFLALLVGRKNPNFLRKKKSQSE